MAQTFQEKSSSPLETQSHQKQKNKAAYQMSTLELQLKDYQGQIDGLLISKKVEKEKLEQSSRLANKHKDEMLEKIESIEREKEILLKKVREYEEVIEGNSGQILRLESVNKNRIALLREKSDALN